MAHPNSKRNYSLDSREGTLYLGALHILMKEFLALWMLLEGRPGCTHSPWLSKKVVMWMLLEGSPGFTHSP